MLNNYRSLSANIIICSVLIFVMAFFSGCTGASVKGLNKPDNKMGIANPASVNCIKKGGSLSIQKGTDGGEYGICTFEDNRQCEEWQKPSDRKGIEDCCEKGCLVQTI